MNQPDERQTAANKGEAPRPKGRIRRRGRVAGGLPRPARGGGSPVTWWQYILVGVGRILAIDLLVRWYLTWRW